LQADSGMELLRQASQGLTRQAGPRLSHKKQQGTVVQSSPPKIMAKIPSK